MSWDENNKMLAGSAVNGTLGPMVRNRDIVPNLRAQRDELMLRVQKIDQLMGLLEKNPEFVKMLDLTRELI